MGWLKCPHCHHVEGRPAHGPKAAKRLCPSIVLRVGAVSGKSFPFREDSVILTKQSFFSLPFMAMCVR